jgi:hypothetical protein
MAFNPRHYLRLHSLWHGSAVKFNNTKLWVGKKYCFISEEEYDDLRAGYHSDCLSTALRIWRDAEVRYDARGFMVWPY